MAILNENLQQATKVLLQLGLYGRIISSSAYPAFGLGGRNSVGHEFLTSTLVYKFNFISGQTVG